MEHSSGIIPYRKNKDGVFEFFLAHPTNAGNYYAFAKGRREGNENDEETARREFFEETGVLIPIDLKINNLGTVKQRSNKTVTAFSVEYPNINPDKCFSNLIDNSTLPENDKYGWFTFDELERMTHRSHIEFYEKIMKEN